GLRGRGYRLIPPVEPDPAIAAAMSAGAAMALTESQTASPIVAATPVPSSPVRRRWKIGAGAVIAAVAVIAALFAIHRPKTSVDVVAYQPRVIAVLPFDSLSTDAGNEYIAAGMAESVLNRLGT